jgi:hypothetical protein
MKGPQLVVLALAIGVLISASSIGKAERGVQGWEYKNFSVYFDKQGNASEWWENGKKIAKGESAVAKFNEYGAQGWELVGTVPYTQYFWDTWSGASAIATNVGGVAYYFKRAK